jgi:CRISPR-associated exonuclease Cas4
MFTDDELLPISALQHLLFCARQCALIHLERVWAENRLTTEGRHLHAKAHDGPPGWEGRVRVARGLALRSYRYGLAGQADVVEFEPPVAVPIPAKWHPGSSSDWSGWRITPIEYKRGRPKQDDSDRVQLCAQALCLEEMLAVSIDSGALYYGRRRRRTVVPLDAELRELTVGAIRRLHELIASGQTPPAVREPKCDNCSLIDICLPDLFGRNQSATRYFERAVESQLAATAPATDLDTRKDPL